MPLLCWSLPSKWRWPRRRGDYRCYRNLSYNQPVTHGNQRVTLHELVSGLPTSFYGDKHCLDLYLPKPAARSAPLVVFVHGGGWRRGDRQGWRHYISDCDTNMLVAFAFWLLGLYGSVGETLAGSGVACAVVSYPLSRLPFPRCLVEHLLSLAMSLTPTWLLLWLFAVCATCSTTSHLFLTNQAVGQLPHLGAVTFFLAVIIRWTVIFRRLSEHIPSPTKGHVWLGTLLGCLIFTWLCILCLQGGPYSLTFPRVVVVVACVMVEVALVQMYLRPAPIQHPDHVCAIATCVAWLMAVGVTALDGSWEPGGLYLMGHSAGGHLVSLLTLNQTFLQEVGLNRKVIKGVLTISGVYDLSWMSSRPLNQYYLRPAFGPDHVTWCQASPLSLLHAAEMTLKDADNHLSYPIPPFLICCAATELPGLMEQAEDFCQELKAQGAYASYHVITGTNHFSIIPKLKPQSQLERLCVEFVNGVNLNSEHCL